MLQVKWLEERLDKVTRERDYYRRELHQAAAAARSPAASLLNGAPADLHTMGAHSAAVGGQLDLSLSGAAAAVAAATAAQDDYKRDVAAAHGFNQNNNDIKIGSLR